MKFNLCSASLFIWVTLQSESAIATTPNDVCIPLASKHVKDGIQIEVQNQVCVQSMFPFISPSFQTQSFGTGPTALIFDAGFKSFPKTYKAHVALGELTVYDDFNSIIMESVTENAFDLSGCYIKKTVKGFDFANVYMARVEDFIPAIPLLFPSCKAAFVNKTTSEVIAAETRNVTCK
ncbi:hypothetical protein Unana1_04687 [Umbelopsis nana]